MSDLSRSPDPLSVAERSIAVQQSEDFQRLRRSFLSFIVPLTVLFLAWYLLYVILAGWTHEFFAIKVFGNVNVGLLFGFGQVITTFAITMFYRSWADKRYDPHAEAIRAEMESGEILEDSATPGAGQGAADRDSAAPERSDGLADPGHAPGRHRADVPEEGDQR
ncbi:hypothetical protein DEO23_06650 [Brachybacterium endophyticum]|uniref:DUF485 domain-containing protein n=1 Tax=Brachybacterium endophyticum TaxID=2182385 RepID=A0A2U2RL74_9MICO|nr:DUF485 domain-containing protein [Brachybacterium endophyticum]PWH06623.1 hypothetical protein DEO23_06650 [Brachybacterium endophyticum]